MVYRYTLVLAGLALVLTLVAHASQQGLYAASQTTDSEGVSVRLVIPKIHVDAAVENLGLTPDGAMDVPKGPADAAWYDLGTRPGEIGSAVIAGHSGWKDGIPAVFDNLYTLQKGDRILVVNESGMTTTFVVRESHIYDPKADATIVFNSSDGKAHLNLITCIGAWNKASKSTSERLVVFADKI